MKNPLEMLKGMDLKKATTVLLAVGAAVGAFTNSIGEQKKEQEFEALKEAVKQLQEKE